MSRPLPPLTGPSGKQIARRAGLRYVQRSGAGYARVRRGQAFTYLDTRGRPAGPTATGRIRGLVLPPAWTDVWICRDPQGHLQATGRDARGRTQYRYHAEWTRAVAALKFERMTAFARSLPAMRRRLRRDLSRPGLPRERVVAAVVGLLQHSLIRVGNDEYARDNGSFGLTTIRKRHVVRGATEVSLRFRGKSGVRHEVTVGPGTLVAVIAACLKLPGRDLFQYRDATGTVRDVKAADVNAYLAELGGEGCTAKDFRTWAATVLMHGELLSLPAAPSRALLSKAALARNVRAALGVVADALRNTIAVCRKAYVHPRVIDAYTRGQAGFAARRGRVRGPALGRASLSALERRTLDLLENGSVRGGGPA
ncbi:MAG: DNA topoisomerase IB [Gammaproteobacteria bacterium]